MKEILKSKIAFHARVCPSRIVRLLFASLCCAVLLPCIVRAQSAGATGQQQKPQPPAGAAQGAASAGDAQSAAQKYFSDVELINQNGERMRFYSDLLKGKVVVVNSFFGTCTSVCPPMNRNLEKVQEAFKDRIGKDLYIISISVDPEVDTPPLLKDYAAKFHAVPGRFFLTGKKENVNWALYKLGQYVEDKNDHQTIIIIGNERTGMWKKAFGMAKVEELIEIIRSVLNDKGEGMEK
jgi:protein SCO1/2